MGENGAMTNNDEGNVRIYGHDMLMNLRALTLEQLAVYERELGISPTTSDYLKWIKHRGPCDAIIAKQVAHIRLMEKG